MIDVEQSVSNLVRYCHGQSWAGYDPYDGLNSPLARSFLFKSLFARTAMTQLLKRSPFNLRPIFSIKKELNSKGVALAARALMLLADRRGCSLPPEIEESSQSELGGPDAGFRS